LLNPAVFAATVKLPVLAKTYFSVLKAAYINEKRPD